MFTKTKTLLLGATMLCFGGAAFAQDMNMTIAENGRSATNFTSLVAAADKAGLTELLMGPGPYTVFAPSNDAFAVADPQVIAELMLPENQEHLANLLKAHVIAGLYTSSDLEKVIGSGMIIDANDVNMKINAGVIDVQTLAGTSAHMFIRLNGDQFDISDDANNMVQAQIVEADIMSSNGVVHIIDHLLSPVAY
jgi:uncharacterized surface protein with fasciclin (FAS1) repeats